MASWKLHLKCVKIRKLIPQIGVFVFMASEIEQRRSPQPGLPSTKIDGKKKSAIGILGEFIEEFAIQEMDPASQQYFSGEHLSKKQKIRRIERRIKEKTLSLGEKVAKPAIAVSANIFINLTEQSIVKRIKPEYPEGFKERIVELDQLPDSFIVLVGNHQALPDGGSMAAVNKDIVNIVNTARPQDNPSRGSMLTIAYSLVSGHQNPWIKEAIAIGRERLEDSPYFLPMEPFVREKDRIKYGIDDNNAEYTKRVFEIINRGDQRVADNLAFYVSGTMEEGRRIKEGENKGQIKGLQEMDCEQFYQLMRIAKLRYHKDAMLIGVGSNGGYEILDPDHDNRPTLKAIGALANPLPSRKNLLTVKVGMPKSFTSILEEIQQQKSEKITAKDFTDYLGRNILAPLLPPHARGIYA